MVPRLVADIVEVVVSHPVSKCTDRWQVKVFSILIVPVVIWIVIINWSLTMTAIRLEIVLTSLARVCLDLVIKHLLLVRLIFGLLRIVMTLLTHHVVASMVLRLRWRHLRANILRRWIHLNADFVDHRGNHLWRFFHSYLFFQFLILYK